MYVLYGVVFILFVVLLILIILEETNKNNIYKITANINYDENMSLKNVNILGTHDSMSYNMNNYYSPFAKTQNCNLQTQYNLGVRYFDIRFKKKNDGSIVAYHGIVDLKITREEIFDFFFEIVKNDKSFVIINMLFEDNSMVLYPDIIMYLKEKNFIDNCIFNTGKIPLIKDLYNKIFFLNIHKISSVYSFLLFKYNTVDTNFNIKKEDVNDASMDDKIKIIKKVLSERDEKRINVIHFSLQTNIYLSINYISRTIHNAIKNDGILKNKKGFILIFDYVDDLYNGLIKHIEI